MYMSCNDGQRIKREAIKSENVDEFWKDEHCAVYASAHQMRSYKIGSNDKDDAVNENDSSVLPSAVEVSLMLTIYSTVYLLLNKAAETLRKRKILDYEINNSKPYANQEFLLYFRANF